jgi:Zn-dependent peptidase ImmA (M78 family)
MSEELVSYQSKFLPNVVITVVFKENSNYPFLKKLFDEYGYGFYAPEMRTIIIDGEAFIGDDALTKQEMDFVEAHEVAHLMLKHSGPRNEKDEIEADLLAYKLLKGKELSTQRLVDEFEFRHGVEFSEDLLSMIEDRI